MQLDRKVLAFGQLPATKGDLYAPSSGRKGFLHNITLHNTNTTAEDVVLNYHDGTNEYEILSEAVPAGVSLYLDFPGEGEVVGSGGKLTGNTDTASKVTYKFSGTEEIPGTIQDDVLWEWNGSDITQFGDGAGTPDYVVNGANGTFSAGAVPTSGVDVPTSNVLRYASGSATSAYAYFLINDLPDLPERYVIRARLGPRELSNTFARVVCMAQDATHAALIGYGGSAGTYAVLCNNTDSVTAAHTLLNSSLTDQEAGVVVEIECMAGEPSSGVDPRINMILKEARGGLIAYGKGGPTWSTIGSPPAIYHSSWQLGGSIRRPGLAFYCNGIGGTAAWVGELQILQHSWQKGV